MKFKFYAIIILTIFSVNSPAQKRSFFREYTYRASDTDSKISSREKALKEVKALLIEELGIYVESYVNYEITEVNGKLTRDFFTNEIKTFSAGISETKIIEEKWDGYNYYVKAKILADPEEVIRHINKTLSKRRSSVVIDSLYIMIQLAEVELLKSQKELAFIQSEVVLKNNTIDSVNTELNNLNHHLSLKNNRIVSLNNEIRELKNKLHLLDENEKKLTQIQKQLIKEYNQQNYESRQKVSNFLIGQQVTTSSFTKQSNITYINPDNYISERMGNSTLVYCNMSGVVIFAYRKNETAKWANSNTSTYRIVGAFEIDIAELILSELCDKVSDCKPNTGLYRIQHTYSSKNLISKSLPGY